MSDTATTRERVLTARPEDDHALIHAVAEQLDSIRNNRLGCNDPVEDWLYDAACVVIDTVRDATPEARR